MKLEVKQLYCPKCGELISQPEKEAVDNKTIKAGNKKRKIIDFLTFFNNGRWAF